MKTAFLAAIALVILSSVPMHSQQAGASAQDSASATVGNRSVNESSAANLNTSRNGASGAAYASGNTQMSPVSGELQSSLDAKHTRVGQQVIVKTTRKARMADGTMIPKGTRLIGHVTSVQPRESGNSGSSMAIDFDRAELKGGQSMAIHSMIESVSPAANMAASAMGDEGDDAMMAPAGGGGFARGGGLVRTSASRGGGLLGGATSAVGATGSSVVSTTDSVGRNTVGATGRAAGDLSATAGNGLRGTVNGTANGTGALAAHATAIPGVMLAGDATGATSGTLSASRRNVHLDSGTQLVLGVSSAVR